MMNKCFLKFSFVWVTWTSCSLISLWFIRQIKLLACSMGSRQICKLRFCLLWHMLLTPLPCRQISCRPCPGGANHNHLSNMRWVGCTEELPMGALLWHFHKQPKWLPLIRHTFSLLWLAVDLSNCVQMHFGLRPLITHFNELRGSRLICICKSVWRCQTSLHALS